MLGKIVVCTAVYAFQLFKAKWEIEFDIDGCISVVGGFKVVFVF